MDITEIKLEMKDERGTLHKHEKTEIVKRKAGSVSANHKHEEQEELLIISGHALVTVGQETLKIQEPSRILIKPNEYHKIEALTDIILIANKSSPLKV